MAREEGVDEVDHEERVRGGSKRDAGKRSTGTSLKKRGGKGEGWRVVGSMNDGNVTISAGEKMRGRGGARGQNSLKGWVVHRSIAGVQQNPNIQRLRCVE
eukprot:760371-Hanusia_phi.AAC.5